MSFIRSHYYHSTWDSTSKMSRDSHHKTCARTEGKLPSEPMKLALAVLAYGVMAAILGTGILFLTWTGKPWLLIVAFIAFVVAFGKIGCKSH
jgi:hypothetical protein